MAAVRIILILPMFFFVQARLRHGDVIERMMNACEEYGCEMPQYRYDGTGLWVVFKFKDTSQKTRQKLPIDQTKGSLNLTEQQNEIIKYIKEHPYATRTELIECIKTGKSGGIRYNLSRLKELGLLKRVGGRKYGHWEILSGNND